jgi:NAD(P)-dependent dehydrogenase (short-subunit alcohol dehydrogenase family)
MLEERGAEGVAVHADVSVAADVDTMVAAAIERYGRLDVLYNNAAVQMSGRLVDCTEEEWDLTIATNLSAIFWACRAALPHLLDGDGGSIINTASTLGLIGSEGYAAYGAAKAGLVLLTKQIAVEYGPGVRANVIAPGSINTPRFQKVLEKTPGAAEFVAGLERTIPVRRLGTAEDVAAIALFLASDMSAYVSGAVLPADGGLAVYR